jgi:hypothetical protein
MNPVRGGVIFHGAKDQFVLELVDGEGVGRRRVVVMVVAQLGAEVFLLNAGKLLCHIFSAQSLNDRAPFNVISAAESMGFRAAVGRFQNWNSVRD